MKTKLVLWGIDANDAKVLLALQLRAEDNIVDVWAFHGEHANSEVHRRLLYEWREGKEMAFPESGYTHHARELTATDTLLPDDLRIEKDDLIQRAQTEWHFVVLSAKLNQAYQEELVDLESKVLKKTAFDQGLWEELKTFWDKVQEQVRERNLGRDHADLLRDKTNALFSHLKELRSALDAEFKDKALMVYERFNQIMAGFDARLRDGANLGLLFDELKDIQKEFRAAKLTRDLRSKMWDRIDGTFKKVKEKRFGESASSNSPVERLKRRYDGLINAIKRMDQSIRKDEDELNFQKKKIASSSTGQLETQIREAKVKMIMERIRSKKEKLSDMNVTRDQLEKQMEKEKAKEAAMAQKKADAAARKAELAAKRAADAAKKAEEDAAKKAEAEAAKKAETEAAQKAEAEAAQKAEAEKPAETVLEEDPAAPSPEAENNTEKETTLKEDPKAPKVDDEAEAKESTAEPAEKTEPTEQPKPEVSDEADFKEGLADVTVNDKNETEDKA